MTSTWDRTRWHEQMVLSNGDLTVTAQTGYSVSGLAVDPIIGKRYFEIVLDDTDGNGQVGVGIANNSVNRSSYLGGDSNGIGWWPGPGDVYNNNGPIGNVGRATANGDIIRVATDDDARTIRYAANGGAWSSPISIAGIAGPIYPAIAVTRPGEAATARFAKSSWSFSAPVGFGEINAPLIVPPKSRSRAFIID